MSAFQSSAATLAQKSSTGKTLVAPDPNNPALHGGTAAQARYLASLNQPKQKGTPKKFPTNPKLVAGADAKLKPNVGDDIPDTLEAEDAARSSAYSAAQRVRKRAGAGSTVLTGLKMGSNPTPTASYTPLTLVGGS